MKSSLNSKAESINLWTESDDTFTGGRWEVVLEIVELCASWPRYHVYQKRNKGDILKPHFCYVVN